MENANEPVTVEPKRELETANFNFSEHKKLLKQFFNQEKVESLNSKEKQDLINKIKTSLIS